MVLSPARSGARPTRVTTLLCATIACAGFLLDGCGGHATTPGTPVLAFTAVPDPGDLPQLMSDLRFTRLHDVAIRNATTGTDAYLVRLAADGS